MKTRSALFLVLTALLVAGVAGADDHGVFTAADVDAKWQAGPPSLPAGVKFVVLEGDPSKAGPFTMRLRFPDGLKVPPHWHPAIEHITVLAGTLHLGMGDTFDAAKTTAMTAGTFGFMPAETRHYGRAEGDTVLQLHGVGPWGITYVNPADDPRAKKP
jgi:quercetin dioxygenase-like cupin family protein